jgi:hypothetical protein
MQFLMGTNYYSVKKGVEKLDSDSFWSLKGEEDLLHIGKSSAGWCFSLHIIPEFNIHDLPGWVPYLFDQDRLIINEYREVLTYEEMIAIITARGREKPCTWTQEMYDRNHAEPGPGNLARHALGHGCVRQGAGTWDCIEGEFS